MSGAGLTSQVLQQHVTTHLRLPCSPPFHTGPSAAPPLAPSKHDTRKDRPHAPAWRASEPVAGAAGGGREEAAQWPWGPVWRVSPEPQPGRPLAVSPHSPGPRLAGAGLRSHARPPPLPRPRPSPGRAPPAPHPRRPPRGPQHSRHVRRRLLPVLSALEAARRARNTSPGPLPPPPRLRPASSFPSKAAK